MPRRKTHEEFIKELQSVNPNIEILENYKYALEPLKCRCPKDGYEWSARPADLLRGKGCPKCAGNIKKTHGEFVEEMYSVDPNIEILSKYEVATTRIQCKCKIDGHEWDATANNLLRGYGCPICGGHITISYDEFIEKLSIINPDVEVVGDYINCSTPVLCRCKIDGNEWYIAPSHLLGGRGCLVCCGKIKKSHEQFVRELQDINSNITILGKYINYETKLLCKCDICSHEWYATPNNLLKYKGCPICKKSRGERMVVNYLTSNNIGYQAHIKFDDLLGVGLRPLSYDFYIPQFNLLIEIQGKQHEMPIDYFGGEQQYLIQKEHDKRKYEYAKEHNINLLQIWYYDFNKIEDILKSHLLNRVA